MERVIDPATVRVKDVIEEVYREAGRGADDSLLSLGVWVVVSAIRSIAGRKK